MADEKEKPASYSAWQIVFVFAAIMGLLIYFWYQNGGPQNADLRGVFLAPPAPVGSGDAYGPQPGTPQEVAPQSY